MSRPLGISSSMLNQELTREHFELAAHHGFECVELYVPLGGSLFTDDAAVADAGRALSDAGLTTWSIHAPYGGEVDLSTPEELQRRAALTAVTRAAEVGRALGAELVVAHAGLTCEHPEEFELRWRQSLRSVNCLLKRAAQLGLRLALEYLAGNRPRICSDSAQILEFFALCDGEPVVCLDTNHANLGEPLAHAMRTLGGHVATLHISDNDGAQERHVVPGDGVIDWREFVALLDETGYAGPLMMETSSGGTVAELVALSAARAREHLGWEGPDVRA